MTPHIGDGPEATEAFSQARDDHQCYVCRYPDSDRRVFRGTESAAGVSDLLFWKHHQSAVRQRRERGQGQRASAY